MPTDISLIVINERKIEKGPHLSMSNSPAVDVTSSGAISLSIP